MFHSKLLMESSSVHIGVTNDFGTFRVFIFSILLHASARRRDLERFWFLKILQELPTIVCLKNEVCWRRISYFLDKYQLWLLEVQTDNKKRFDFTFHLFQITSQTHLTQFYLFRSICLFVLLLLWFVVVFLWCYFVVLVFCCLVVFRSICLFVSLLWWFVVVFLCCCFVVLLFYC
jgi:hypothetical protein